MFFFDFHILIWHYAAPVVQKMLQKAPLHHGKTRGNGRKDAGDAVARMPHPPLAAYDIPDQNSDIGDIDLSIAIEIGGQLIDAISLAQDVGNQGRHIAHVDG